tara:strand:+ start:308 stop:1936 length:1629 start_codon:yes stop_codon:yes gene_type:complete
MAKKLQLRRGTTSQHSSFTGEEGEVTVDTEKDVLVVHDGSTAGGHPSVKSGSIATADLGADCVDGTKIADDAVANEHIASDSIGATELKVTGNGTSGQYLGSDADGTFTWTSISSDPSMGGDLSGTASNAQLVANSVDSDQYVDGSIDLVHLSADCVDGTKIADDAINSEHLVNGSVDDAHLATGISSSKLTGALPAISGASLTGITAGPTISASDPAITTNASLGTQWANSTSGEFYILTDATSNKNYWTNVGAGDGDITPWSPQGSLSGYTTGGISRDNVIDKFSFTSDGNATDVGDLSVNKNQHGSTSSDSHGYSSGDDSGSGKEVIDKFNFASGGNATDVGNLVLGRQNIASCTMSTSHGYSAGGGSGENNIEKYSHSSDGNATDVGDLTSTITGGIAGHSSSNHGYRTCNHNDDVIDKWTFSSDANATDVGNLTQGRQLCAGQNDASYGYASGGYSSYNIIDRFAFASDGNATDVGDLTRGGQMAGGQSSQTHGYTSCGYSGGNVNTIDKYAFSSSSNATDVGDCTVSGRYCGGCQV